MSEDNTLKIELELPGWIAWLRDYWHIPLIFTLMMSVFFLAAIYDEFDGEYLYNKGDILCTGVGTQVQVASDRKRHGLYGVRFPDGEVRRVHQIELGTCNE